MMVNFFKIETKNIDISGMERDVTEDIQYIIDLKFSGLEYLFTK